MAKEDVLYHVDVSCLVVVLETVTIVYSYATFGSWEQRQFTITAAELRSNHLDTRQVCPCSLQSTKHTSPKQTSELSREEDYRRGRLKVGRKARKLPVSNSSKPLGSLLAVNSFSARQPSWYQQIVEDEAKQFFSFQCFTPSKPVWSPQGDEGEIVSKRNSFKTT